MNYLLFNQKLFDGFRKFTLSNWGVALLACWAFFESSIWFIIPDFILLIFVAVNPKNFVKLFFIIFVSSVSGMLAHMAFVYFYPQTAYEILLHTPLISPSMPVQVNSMYAEHGSVISLWQPFSAIPGKVWTFVSVNSGLNLWTYMFLVTVSRGIRIFLTAFIVSKISLWLNKLIRNNFAVFMLIYLVIFAGVLYLLYF